MTVLAAVSGGADSVALLCGLHRIRRAGPGRIVAAHFNHGLRGGESDADEAFVRRLCGERKIECVVGRRPAAGDRVSEQRARTARYGFFRRAASETGARYVVTAHTADDQAETILHRVLRGTGIGGLAGIPRGRELLPGVALLRPLLDQRRETVQAYLASLGQSHRIDSSNRDPGYTRNRIRHELLAVAAAVHPDVVPALVRLGRQADEVQQFVDGEAMRLAERCDVQLAAGRITLGCRPLRGAPRLLVRHLLVQLWRQQDWPLAAMGFVHWDQLAGLILEDPGGPGPFRLTLPGGIMARRERGQLEMLAPASTSPS